MHNIRVQFTIPNVEKVANLDVHINGEKRNMKFRVETFDFQAEQSTPEGRVAVLRSQIEHYDKEWELYHIGSPFDDKIPVTFKYRS